MKVARFVDPRVHITAAYSKREIFYSYIDSDQHRKIVVADSGFQFYKDKVVVREVRFEDIIMLQLHHCPSILGKIIWCRKDRALLVESIQPN